jgi:hypothetical protein
MRMCRRSTRTAVEAHACACQHTVAAGYRSHLVANTSSAPLPDAHFDDVTHQRKAPALGWKHSFWTDDGETLGDVNAGTLNSDFKGNTFNTKKDYTMVMILAHSGGSVHGKRTLGLWLD